MNKIGYKKEVDCLYYENSINLLNHFCEKLSLNPKKPEEAILFIIDNLSNEDLYGTKNALSLDLREKIKEIIKTNIYQDPIRIVNYLELLHSENIKQSSNCKDIFIIETMMETAKASNAYWNRVQTKFGPGSASIIGDTAAAAI